MLFPLKTEFEFRLIIMTLFWCHNRNIDFSLDIGIINEGQDNVTILLR